MFQFLHRVKRPVKYDKEFLKVFSTGEDEIELPGHPHPLFSTVYPESEECSECPEGYGDYICCDCSLLFCKECAESPQEIEQHSYHSKSKHSLTFLATDTDGGRCSLCGDLLRLLGYHCSVCDFKSHPFCARNPPPLVIDNLNCHHHSLTLMPRKVSFTCDACGVNGDWSPCVCSHCAFMVHLECVYLPRVININRHDHRVSHAYPLGPEKCVDSVCGVCRRKVDGDYGGYSCSSCPSYIVHSRCATRRDVWDEIELEGEPEEDDSEDIKSFKVISDKVINHFSHEEHNLKLIEDDIVRESIRCRACVTPIHADAFYSCMGCDDFALHEKCAGLPRKKRHGLHSYRFTLKADGESRYLDNYGIFRCSACKRLNSGFRYECCNIKLDLLCASISEPLMDRHRHPLYLTTLEEKKICGGCKSNTNFVLSCVDCEFALDFKCATLPKTARHKYDKHPLTLCFGEDTSDGYWCDVCETKLDAKRWFYACDDCSTTIHIDCVFKGFAYMRPGHTFESWSRQYQVVDNTRSSRPLCYECKSHCDGPILLVHTSKFFDTFALCSDKCFFRLSTRVCLRYG